MLLLVSKPMPFILLIIILKWIIIIFCIIRLIIFADICYKKLKIQNEARSSIITASIIFSFHRTISFFERFNLSFSYFMFHLLMYLENLILYIIYLFISLKNAIDFSLAIVVLGLVLVLTFMPLGLIIELIYWKLLFKFKSPNKKFDIQTI